MILKRIGALAAAATLFTGAGLIASSSALAEDAVSPITWNDEYLEYADYQALVDDLVAAQQEVDRLTGEVATLAADVLRLEGELFTAEGNTADMLEALGVAEDARDAAQLELNQATTDLATAQLNYNTAHAIAHCNSLAPGPGRGACSDAKTQTTAALTAAQTTFNTETTEFNAAQAAYDTALENHGDAVEAEGAKNGELEAASTLLAQASSDLLAAEETRNSVQDVVNDWTPPVAGQHPGCNGVTNAQAQVAKSSNSKGKAAEVLNKVADKLGC